MNIGQDITVKKIADQFKTNSGKKDCLKIEGTWGSFGRLLVSYISKQTNRPILYICPHIDDADKAPKFKFTEVFINKNHHINYIATKIFFKKNNYRKKEM